MDLVNVYALHVRSRAAAKGELGLGSFLALPLLLRDLVPGDRLPGPVLVQDDLVLVLGQLLGAHAVDEVPVEIEVLVESWAVAHRAQPGRLLLVHLDEEVRVETLEMVAGGGPTRGGHPHLAERTREGHLDVGGGDIIVLVVQLLLDHLLGELLVLGSPLLEPVQQLVAGELLDQEDGDDPALAVLGRPLDLDVVGEGGGELAQRRDVRGLGRPLGLHPLLVGRDRVGQRTHFPVHLDTDAGRELVPLLLGRVKRTEPVMLQ